MALNAQRWLAEAGFPPVTILTDPAPQSDHCYLSCDSDVVRHAEQTMDRWLFMIRAADHQPLGYSTARAGWRERRARWAAQLIQHHDPIGSREFLELDFDTNNPNWGLALVVAHALYDWCWQKISKTKTNPFTVAKKRGWVEA